MVLRALRPPMIFGASLPGMIFPAQRPAEGSNSYHYGSYATVQSDAAEPEEIAEFPYHYGSYATYKRIQRIRKRFYVSIPLWFLRNERIEQNNLEGTARFHTTMVHTRAVLR